MDSFLDDLSEVQREAVCYNSGPSLVVAGAGSGKTRVLTYKVVQLINDGVKPSSILVLTFTRKAAKEMKQRVISLVGEQYSSKLWMGTFHSIFGRILRIESVKLDYSPDFTIYCTTDSLNLIKSIISEKKLDKDIYKERKILSRISQLKNDLISPSKYSTLKDYHDNDMRNRMPMFAEIYKAYCYRCKKANVMDYDDLLFNMNVLFRDHPDVLAKYQNIFKFTLVDEYQDTNFSQFLIIKKLSSKNHKVCVVGDDAQSIYSFRGAKIENILNFSKEYPECKVFKLEQNYRSTKNIVAVANSLIKNNDNQIPKNVFSEGEVGSKISVISAMSDVDESLKVKSLLLSLKKHLGCSYSDFAVLYRTNAQSRVLEDSLRKNGIPYKIWGTTSFYERKEILDVISYFRLIVNPDDEEAFKRVINFPARGIGDVTLNKIKELSLSEGVSFWTIISNPIQYKLQISAGTASKIVSFKNLLDSFIMVLNDCDAYELGSKVIHEVGILLFLKKDNTPEGISKSQNVEELLNLLYQTCSNKLEQDGEKYSMNEFLAEVALMTSQDNDDSADKVTLMTIHASKGLEFNNVFIVGLEEELFPSNMSTGSIQGIEEERRLFYVAITRAKQNCFFFYSKSRLRNGTYNQSNPSRFIKDIDPKLLNFDLAPDFMSLSGLQQNFDMPSSVSHPFSKPRFSITKPPINRKNTISIKQVDNSTKRLIPISKIPSFTPDPMLKYLMSNIHVGSLVSHTQFGIGSIVSLIGFDTTLPKVVIKFNSFGEKTLILKYAKLQLLK